MQRAIRGEKDSTGEPNTHLDFNGPLIVAIAVERMRVRLGVLSLALGDGDPLPSELLDRDERLLQVRVLRHKVRPKMESEPLRMQDMRRRLCQVCKRVDEGPARRRLASMWTGDVQYVMFLTIAHNRY